MLQEMPGRLTRERQYAARFHAQGKPMRGDIRDGTRQACKLAGIDYGATSGAASRCTTCGTRSRRTYGGQGRQSGKSWRSPAIAAGARLIVTRRSMRRTSTGRLIGRRYFQKSVAFSVARAQKKTRPKPGLHLQLLDFIYGAEGRTMDLCRNINKLLIYK
jgi:hypothetical protein